MRCVRNGYTSFKNLMRSIKGLFLSASVVALLAAGCSNAAPTVQSVAPKQLDVCGLLDATMASNVLGGKVTIDPGAVVPSGNGFVSTCTFTSDEARGINVLLRQNTSKAEAQKLFADSKASSQSGDTAPVDLRGLGDGAFWLGGTQNQLDVVYKNNWMVITVYGLPGDDRLTVGRNAAAALLRGL